MTKVKKRDFQKTLDELWDSSKKEFDKMAKETGKLFKKSEIALKEVSQKSQEALELVNATLRREKLYYQLGKTTASLSKNQRPQNKKISSMIKEISRLEKQIKQSKKK